MLDAGCSIQRLKFSSSPTCRLTAPKVIAHAPLVAARVSEDQEVADPGGRRDLDAFAEHVVLHADPAKHAALSLANGLAPVASAGRAVEDPVREALGERKLG